MYLYILFVVVYLLMCVFLCMLMYLVLCCYYFEQHCEQSVFNASCSGAGDGPEAKRPKVDDDLAGGIEGMTRAKVTEVRFFVLVFVCD